MTIYSRSIDVVKLFGIYYFRCCLSIEIMASGGQRTSTESVIAHEEQSQPVRIIYDTWTPRPHFIIVQCEPKPDATVAERQAAFELTGRFLLANRSLADDAILSFHRGNWYQEHTSKWHAHLCVPQQAYLEKARDKVSRLLARSRGVGTENCICESRETNRTKDVLLSFLTGNG